MHKIAIIRRLPSGKYRLYSKKKGPDGKRKNLGTYDTRAGAEQREREVQYFKHNADDGKSSKQNKMLSDLSNIANYLEEAGYVGKAKELYDVMCLVDGSLAQSADDLHFLPNVQMNTENQGYIGGEGIAGGYSGLSVPEAMRAEDQNNVDMMAGSNGLRGNTVTDDNNAGMFQGFSDAYFYTGYGELESPYR